MSTFRTWLNPLLAAALVSGCALTAEPKAKAGDKVNTDAGGVFTLPKIDTGVSQTKTAIADFKQLNSSENFTMPIGNNFTMPIGNNFTMPIGNNLIGNVGAGYRIAAALTGQILFGFVPIPKGTDITRTGGPTGLPTKTDPAQIASVGGAADTNIDATLNLAWWDDTDASGREGYQNKITYNRLKTTVNGESKEVSGSFGIRMSGPATTGNWTAPDASKSAETGGAILLGGNNVNPRTLSRRVDDMDMKLGSINVASVSVDQKDYENFEIPLPKGANNQDPKPVIIQVPKTVNVAGFLTRPDGGASMGVSLAASLNATAKLFTLSGWLKQCKGATCTASSAGTLKTTTGEVREEFTLDVASATSKLVFTKYPTASETFGWRMTLYYDYAVSMLKGTAGTTALTGDLWLIESGGTNVVGGKLAAISSDADGNLKLKYPDETTETWKLF